MLSVIPLLAAQRQLYDLPRGRGRFRHYLQVMTGGTDDMVLPLTALNPMGKAHVAQALDALLALGAEDIVVEAVAEAEQRLRIVEVSLQVGLVVADDVAGGWTNRELIEANRLRFVPRAMLQRGWLVALYWASEPVTREKVREEVLAAIYRDLYLQRHSGPATLGRMMEVEGRSLAFAHASEPRLDPADLAYTGEVLQPYRDAPVFEEFPTVFTCLYGDRAARRVGYPVLGLSPRAGCALALAEAGQEILTPEAPFRGA